MGLPRFLFSRAVGLPVKLSPEVQAEKERIEQFVELSEKKRKATETFIEERKNSAEALSAERRKASEVLRKWQDDSDKRRKEHREKTFVRFGPPPERGVSLHHPEYARALGKARDQMFRDLGYNIDFRDFEGEERGISCFPARRMEQGYEVDTSHPPVAMALLFCLYSSLGRDAYELHGRYIGKGSVEESLLVDVTAIKIPAETPVYSSGEYMKLARAVQFGSQAFLELSILQHRLGITSPVKK